MRMVRSVVIMVAAVAKQSRRTERARYRDASPDSSRAANVIVVANNVDGGAQTRVLSGEAGNFELHLPRAGRYEIRVLRIGFNPTLVPVLDIGDGETHQLSIILRGTAFALARVDVRGSSSCRVKPDSGLIVARVWEEARKALLASQLAIEGARLFAERIEYDRVLDATGQFVHVQRVRTTSDLSTHGFESVSAETLATAYCVVASNPKNTLFYGPDADVLLSDIFAAQHCLRLAAPPASQPELVGVEFESIADSRSVHDIDGTFWIDRATAELRSLEFRYTNLQDVVAAAGAGGSVDFLRLSDGNWIVSRWNVRLPVLRTVAADDIYRSMPWVIHTDANVVGTDVQSIISSVHSSGGFVTTITRNDTVRYRGTGPTLRVQVISHDTLVTVAGATVALDGTDYTATADAKGRIALTPVLDGKYRASIWSPLMDSLGIAPAVVNVNVRVDAHVDSLALPTTYEMLRKACPADSVRHGEGMIRGIARGEKGKALTDAPVTVTWKIPSSKAQDPQFANEQTIGSLTDNAGHWHVCGVPRATELTVRLASDSGSDSRSARLAGSQPFTAIDLVAHLAVADRRGQKAAAPRALVEIAVYGLGEAPLPGATIELTAPGGMKRTVVTGETGRALLPDVTPGLLRVRAKRIGFRAGQLAVTVGAGHNTVPIILSKVSMPALDTVRIVAGRLSSRRFDGFEGRLRTGVGSYITAEQIEQQEPYRLTSLLQARPGIMIQEDGGDRRRLLCRGFAHSLLTMMKKTTQKAAGEGNGGGGGGGRRGGWWRGDGTLVRGGGDDGWA